MRLALFFFFCRAGRTSFYVREHDDEWSRSFGLKLKYCFYGSKGAQKGGGELLPIMAFTGRLRPKGESFRTSSMSPRNVLKKMRSPISLFFKNTIILFVVPPKFCKSIAFNFFWGDFSQEKLKTMLISNFWGTAIKRIMVFLKKAYSSLAHLPKCTLFDPQNFA